MALDDDYNLGESVVHRSSKKMGMVVDAADNPEDGSIESIKIKEAIKIVIIK